MMKLRHLFNNPSLAEMLVKNWDYDESSLDLFQNFRISANAIYPFRRQGDLCFLRCSPTCEKCRTNLEAELAFIRHLLARGYPALQPIPAKSGADFIEKSTPWGEYHACVFQHVTGVQISETSLGDEIVFAFGAALGWLHQLSSGYSPRTRRWDYLDVFNWIEKTLKELGLTAAPLEELQILREYFAALPISAGTYGLIHYDFETDNVFYNADNQTCSVIDFDDAMYHWYVMDIVQSLESLQDECGGADFPRRKNIFLEGYASRHPLDGSLLAAGPVFRRFANLYSYTRIARSIHEQWENEPDWMAQLRARLAESMAEESAGFGAVV